ncbi:MAG TPA: serine hydrolase domain-containing protein [Polyangiaceae bacterium]|nr:serine hydrolase domain-containing protein [Polyangiaceae bacterium]
MRPGRAEISPSLDDLVARTIVLPGVAPGGVVAAGKRLASGFQFAVGSAGVRSARRPEPVDPATPYDLASVTKPFVAATAARLERSGTLSFGQRLGDLVPELRETPAGPRTLEHLLSHRSGLSAHGALYAPLTTGGTVDPEAAIRLAATWMRPECLAEPPFEGHPPVYSDLGYLLLGLCLERAAGAPLEALVRREISEPLGLRVGSARELRNESPSFDARVAPTETVGFRGGEIVGRVHDENAWAVSGDALSGHAGLFGTALDVARFGAAMLDALAGRAPEFLSAGEAARLVVPRAGGTLRAGFDGRAEEGSSAGARFGPRSFGHLGFTGTSLWCDPDADVVAVLLTNRVSPTRDNVKIRIARPDVHDALHQAATGLSAGSG